MLERSGFVDSGARRLRHIVTDSAYTGDQPNGAPGGKDAWTVEIVKRSGATKGFVLLPRRWMVQRTIAWLNRNQRLAKDFAATVASTVTGE